MARRGDACDAPLPAVGFTARDLEWDPHADGCLDAAGRPDRDVTVGRFDRPDGRAPLGPPFGVGQDVPDDRRRCVDDTIHDEPPTALDVFDPRHRHLLVLHRVHRSDETTNTAHAVPVGMQVRPDVTTHAIEWSYGEYVEPLSVHVLDTKAATVMVGGGDDSIAEELLAIARDHGVDVVVIEHAHVDHFGAVPRLREALDITVAIPKPDARSLRRQGVDPDVTLTDGDRSWGIEPIATPGHTPGNMAFLYDDCLLAGDTVAGSDSVFAAEDDWSGPLAVIEPRFNGDDARTRESVGRLPDYDFETVLVSHGSHVLESGPAAVDRLLDDL